MTPATIAERLDALSAQMLELGTAMEYYGGFAAIAAHGIELVGAGHIAAGWAAGIRSDAPEVPTP